MKEEEVIVSKQCYLGLISELSKAQNKIQDLEQQICWFKRRFFGSKADKILPEDPSQFKIPFEEDPSQGDKIKQAEEQAKHAEEEQEKKKKEFKSKVKPHSRMPIPKDYPRVTEIIYPEGDLTDARCIGAEITEKLEFEPGRVYVRQIVRIKYIFPGEAMVPAIAPLPTFAIPSGNAGEGLLAHLIVSKYADHLPLNRQIDIFKRGDFHLSSSTASDWCMAAAQVLEPLYNELRIHLQKCYYVLADETPCPVLKSEKSGSLHRGYMWAFYNTEEIYPFFEYRKGRGYDGADTLFTPDIKVVQSDGYGAYEIFETRKGCTHLCCWAHTRRKFIESQEADPPRARYVLNEIKKLYDIERWAKRNKYTPEEIKDLRQENAYPIIRKLEQWLLDNKNGVRKDSQIGRAMEYMYVRMEKLTRYTTDGRFMIDTNLIERSIRPLTVGRKNYLFAGSHNSADTAAIFYTLIGCCKAHDVNPFFYLRDMLTRVLEHKDIKDYSSLLPWNWKNECEKKQVDILPDYQKISWKELAEKLHLSALTGKPL